MRRLLVIDDDPVSRRLVEVTLGPAGFAVAGAGNGAEALALMDSGYRPDVVLFDLLMPVMDGHAFRREMLSRPALRRIPLVALTAADPIADFECVTKPPNWARLAARLHHLAGRRNGHAKKALLTVLAALLAWLARYLAEKYL